jgi:3-hydroxy acid dehydrogenase / malonic semialdehyde reductase
MIYQPFNYLPPPSCNVLWSARYHMIPLRTARHVLRSPKSLRNISLSLKLANLAILRTMASSAMSKRLEGKTIVITGASSGIGKSTALEFARTSPKNLKLILTARRVDKLEELAKQIRTEVGEGVKVHPVKLDISNPEEVRGFIPALPAEFKEIDVLVNNA